VSIQTLIALAVPELTCWTCVPSNRLPEDGAPVPKHVGVDTYHEI